MTRGKKLLILLLALALVGGGIWVVNKIIEANIVYMTDRTISAFSADTAAATKVIITYDDVTMTLEKQGQSWVYMEDPSNIPDQSVIDEALETLADVRADRALENIEDLAPFGLGQTPVGSVTVVTPTETSILQVGNETAIGQQHYLGSSDGKVFIADDNRFFFRLPFAVDELQEPTISAD